jgi:hypothetical protein
MLTRRLASSEFTGPVNFPGFSFSAQNCNSLNISACCEKQLKKIASIVSVNFNFIFLGDLQLGNNQAVNDLINSFRYNEYCSYEFIYNSNKSSCGVGILINSKINYSVVRPWMDVNNNILSLVLNVDNFVFRCISIYGPNNNDNTFFFNLDSELQPVLRIRATTSVADPDPGSGAFLPQGSRIRDEFFLDPGSRIPYPRSLYYVGSGIRDKHPGSATLATT